MATTFQKYSTAEISASWELWNEFVNPDGNMSFEEYGELFIQELSKMQFEMFPGECDDIDAEGNEITEGSDESDSDND